MTCATCGAAAATGAGAAPEFAPDDADLTAVPRAGAGVVAEGAAAPAPADHGGRRRRTVTVLFIDIVGFTALVDDLDPEDVWALQKDYFVTVGEVVRAFGGVVEKYIGDAVMAVFGTRPDAAGSPPVGGQARSAWQAVRAGLAMQATLRTRRLAGRFTVRTRVGVATGAAIVDQSAATDGGQAMISGSVVATAARLQAYAPHDTVVVCAVTRELTDTLVTYQELPPVTVAGRREPLDIWRALPPRSPLSPGFSWLLASAR